MRLLLTTDTLGGVWTFTRELTCGLLDAGHDVALVSVGREPSVAQLHWTSSMRRQYRTRFRYEVSTVPVEWMEENETAYDGAEQLLLRVIEEFEPSVLHSSQYCFGALPVKIPKVITAHSDVLSWAEACQPQGLEASGWLSAYRTLVQAGLAGADAIVAPTRWMGDRLTHLYDLPESPHMILNGRSLPGNSRSGSRQLKAVSVGRLWDRAKHIDALTSVNAAMPIVVAGEKRLGSTLAPDSLGTTVLLGALSEDDVLKLFSDSSLYLVTSIYEPFGLAPLEAALCGCGVLANDLPSLHEVWGEGALYFNDAASLRELLEKMHTRPEALALLRDRSFKRALELSRERMVGSYVKLYAELLAESAAAMSMNQEVAAYAG